MNLAIKEIKHTTGKFIATAMGVGMLLGIVLIMIGVLRGMISDTKVLANDIQADLWVVQDKTIGPFAESSKIHEDLKNILKAVSGVKITAPFTFQTTQFPLKTRTIKVTVVGYDVFGDINPIKRLVSGRLPNKDHYEIVINNKLKRKIGEKIKLGKDIFTIVGITRDSVDSGGNSLIYMSIKDAKKLQFSYTNPRIRSDRERGIKSGNNDLVNTIVIKLHKGYNPNKIKKHIEKYYHKSVFTQKQEIKILSTRVIEKALKQIGAFTIILIIVATIIIGLIIYTMTLEKMKEISIMKLIGIPNRVIVEMIFQETIILGSLAFIFGNLFAYLIYDKFPKHILLLQSDAWILFSVIIVSSLLSSLIGVKKVILANPQEAIGG